MTGFYIIGNLAFNGLTPCIENNKEIQGQFAFFQNTPNLILPIKKKCFVITKTHYLLKKLTEGG